MLNDLFVCRAIISHHLVLNGLSLHIARGEKVALCGRSGCGKSSVFSSISRLYPISAGRILLGDNDINRMHIERLRTQVQVVDQDAVLLSGPLRNNLSETESDELIWRCLRDAGIEKLVRGLPGQLDFLVVDGGGNFSAGERQLIALARALITQDTTSLLLCDEVVLRAFP